MANALGISQRIPVYMIEDGLKKVMEGAYSCDYAREIVSQEFEGENRIKKGVGALNRLCLNNPLLPYVKDNWDSIKRASPYKGDRALIYSALICAAYPFGYEVLSVMGKYFAIQDQITTKLIVERISIKYGCNKNLTNTLYMILPMFIEAGLLSRPKPGVYEKPNLEINDQISREIYKHSFLVNNPMFAEDYDFSDYPFMMFMY